MQSTDGLKRGMKVIGTGSPIRVPVGPEVLGHMFNVLGQTIDGSTNFTSKLTDVIHKASPAFTSLSQQAEILETGIKVIDLMVPILKGGKIGLFGGA